MRLGLFEALAGDPATAGELARRAGGRLVGAAIEVPRAARQRVEHLAAIDQVGRRQDQRCMRGPVEDASAPQFGSPGGFADLVGMDFQPQPHDRLGDRHPDRACRHGRQIAQPGEAVEIVRQRLRPIGLGEIEIGDRHALAAKRDPPVEQRIAAAGIADERILGHRDELERMAAAQPKRVERRAPSQFAKAFGDTVGERQAGAAPDADQPLAFVDPVWRAFLAHPPLNAAMLAA